MIVSGGFSRQTARVRYLFGAYNENVVRTRAVPYVWTTLSVGAFVGVLLVANTRHTGTASSVLLLSVLVSARFWGFGPALLAAGLAAASYSYFFLPPAGFAIEDPNDWIAFVVFVGTAFIAGELWARAERRREEAQAGRQEIERLYQELQNAFDRASEAEAARRNEQLKAALLDALTHNLRTPLTAIKAAVTALISAEVWHPRRAIEAEGEHELLQVIDEESDRLNRFIEGLTTAGNTENGHPRTLRAVELGSVLRAARSRAETVTRDHRLVVSIESELPCAAVDPAAIVEALYIVLDNASKYAPAGTVIRIGARSDGERVIRLTVEDEGPGIPVELREQVFDKFFRIPGREPRDARRKGVGLGLSIARRLIAAQGGRMWIDAAANGRGTAVVMTLPASTEPAAETAPALVMTGASEHD